MPRQPRDKSVSGIYHCMLRGINKQDIFFDEQDYLKFIKEIKRTKELYSYKLFSYVLMPNHIHLEIKDEKDNLSNIMQSMQIKYSNYFNQKYEREGHLFQNRYKSIPVESKSYIINLIRYIHQNPEKAKIDKTENYNWSSYQDYQKDKEIIDSEVVFKYLDEENEQTKKEKILELSREIIKIEDSKFLLDCEIRKKLTDEELIYFIKNRLEIENIQEIQKYNKENRIKLLKKIKDIKGWNYLQMSRVLGISIRLVREEIQQC